MKRSFVVQYSTKGGPLREKTIVVELSEEEDRLLHNATNNLKKEFPWDNYTTKELVDKCRFPSELTYDGNISINMCGIDSLNNICQKIQQRFFEWFQLELRKQLKEQGQSDEKAGDNEQADGDFPAGWEDYLLEHGLSLFIKFPAELLYPQFIFKRGTCFSMGNCFQFEGFEGAKELLLQLREVSKESLTPGFINACISAKQEWWKENNFKTVGQQRSVEHFGKHRIITPDLIFNVFDSLWLIYYFLQYNDGDNSAPNDHYVEEYSDMEPYCRNHKRDNPHFRISVSDASDFRPVKIKYPDFCHRMRIALFRKFFAGKDVPKNNNTLKYQYTAFKHIQDDLKPQFSEEEIWYYEMCTGASLTLMITSLFIRLGIDTKSMKIKDPALEYSWKECRGFVLLRVLTEFCPFIITCPAVYWRISVIEGALLSINNEMRRDIPTATVEEQATFPKSLVEWTECAYGVFYKFYSEQCSKIDWPFSYKDCLGRPIRFPNVLIWRVVKQFIDEHQKGEYPTTSKKFESTRDWPIYCPPEYYPYISEIQTEVREMGEPPFNNYRSTTEKQRIFEEVRKALYPDGFIDFEA